MRLARLGAEARLAELDRERQEILRLLGRRGRGRRSSTVRDNSASADDEPRRRRRWSAAQRKAVSARMKKYWASRRQAK